jgi:molybdenum cofactor cytidylyltransferase
MSDKRLSDKTGEKRVAVIVLAAGRSSRLGTPKQLIELEGKTLLRRTVETVLASDIGAGWTSVVIGAWGRQCFRQIQDLPCQRISNPDWREGLSTSVKKGLRYWQGFNEVFDWLSMTEDEGFRRTDAVLFVPCDLPLLSAQHINTLLKAYRENDVPLVVSKFDEVLGTPALFDQWLWDELFELEGDEGARKIIQRHQDKAISVQFEGGKFDLDTPQDVEKFRRGYSNIATPA